MQLRGKVKLLTILTVAILLIAGYAVGDKPGRYITDLTRTAFTSQNLAVPAFSDDGSRLLEGRLVVAAIKRTDDVPQEAGLVIVFDKSSGTFWWEIIPFGLNSTRSADISHVSSILGDGLRFYVGGGRMIQIGLGQMSFGVRVCNEHAASLDEAEAKAFPEARTYLILGRSLDMFPGTKVIYPQKAVDPLLIQDPFSPAPLSFHFIGAARLGKGWVLTVRYFKTFRLILDEDFELKKWERAEE